MSFIKSWFSSSSSTPAPDNSSSNSSDLKESPKKPEADAAPKEETSTKTDKPTESKKSTTNEIDLVFCMDCTGSMSSYIRAAQDNIINIVEKIVASEKADIQFGLVAYRDHPPQDTSYVTKVFDFTSSKKKMLENVNSLSAAGGGDGPEAVTAALDDVLQLPYRKNAVKICVFIADAPPHGLGEDGDGFPNGDPKGRDPLKIARQLLERSITVYTVACEPALSGYKYAVDFFDAVAKITTGKFLPLTSAKLLADVIIGGAQEEMDLEKLKADLEKEVETLRKSSKKPLSEAELAEHISKAWTEKGVGTREVEVDNVYEGRHMRNMELLEQADSMDAIRGKLTKQAYTVSSAQQESHSSVKGMHKEKVARMMKKAFK